VELHPPIAADKGTALVALAERAGADRALFVGDDLGDLAAFDALARLAASGELAATAAVAVGGPELPPAVRDRAQLVLAGPHAVPELLVALRP
jgi:trehalose 6-phosphate phosphatase